MSLTNTVPASGTALRVHRTPAKAFMYKAGLWRVYVEPSKDGSASLLFCASFEASYAGLHVATFAVAHGQGVHTTSLYPVHPDPLTIDGTSVTVAAPTDARFCQTIHYVNTTGQIYSLAVEWFKD